MPAEIFAGLSAIKTALDIAKGLKDIDDAARRNGAVIELQKEIFAAQAAQSALISHVSELEKEVTKFETWEAEKKRYKLNKLPPGVYVRTLKEDMADGEPIHHACEQCYRDGKISPLHATQTHNGIHYLKCTRCGTDLRIGIDRPDAYLARGADDSWMS